MRVFTCLVHEHSWPLVVLAAFVCLIGSTVFLRLSHRTLKSEGRTRTQWWFLASTCAGSSIWATHFIAMLGYRPGVPVHLDGALTIASALIATGGTAVSLAFARSSSHRVSVLCGGLMLGLAIASMHYVGMFAYRPEGLVRWIPEYVAASIVFVMGCSALAIHSLRAVKSDRELRGAVLLLVAAIMSLHFVGMAAFVVTPISDVSAGADSEAFDVLAASIAIAAMLVVGMGVATSLVDQHNKQTHAHLSDIALRDSVTGLANRHSFNMQMLARSEELRSDAQPFALLMLDLDRFKTINDTLGHPVGDLLLQRVAERLRKATRPCDVVARLGGDEFAIILDGVRDRRVALDRSAWIVELLSRPFLIDGKIVQSGASVGVALAPEDSDDAETLLRQVDVALYRAKNEGCSRSRSFDPAMLNDIMERCALESDLRNACMREDFEVLFQPILDARDQSFVGAEALVRWTCPERGEVPPEEFIPVAEEQGLISQIGSMVLQKACQAAAAWPEHLTVAVNVSQVQMSAGWLVASIIKALEDTGLSPGRLEIEITETAIVSDDQGVMQCLEDVRSLGVRIALDDFGTGYSSLSYLHRYPIDRIKIDRSFVCRLPHDASSASIVRAICQLASSLELEVTAEGVETEAQSLFVSLHGCSKQQGYLFGRPMDAKAINALFGGGSRTRAVA